jgi:hypothetical protein
VLEERVYTAAAFKRLPVVTLVWGMSNVQDTHALARMFAAAMDCWICSPFIVLDGPPMSHLHPQFLFYPVTICRCGNVC